MKPLTKTWVDKAEDDLLLARQSRRTAKPVYDGICFHAQQCAEKYLKALLQERATYFPRTHDLVDLLALLGTPITGLTTQTADVKWLTTHAVEIRYPGTSSTKADADRALKIASDIRAAIRTELGI
jgi:HEPN domain-containing protein